MNGYLNEEKYLKTSKNLFVIGIVIILIGVGFGLYMIIPTIMKNTQANKDELNSKLNSLKTTLEEKYASYEANGIKESMDYKNKDGYQMYLIDIALNPTYSKCENSSRYTDNDITREYCKVKAEIYDMNNSFENGKIMFKIVPAIMVMLPICFFGLMFILTAKRREITAYSLQQVMPLAEEGMEKMSPTLGKTAKTLAKNIKDGFKE